MADEKTKVVTDATGPDAGPAPVQPEAGGGAPAPKQEQPAPEAVSPDKAPAPEQAACFNIMRQSRHLLFLFLLCFPLLF